MSKLRLVKKERSSHTKSSMTFEYIWESSIPENWKKILQRQNISCAQLKKSNRNTMKFLEETQKYINNIRHRDSSHEEPSFHTSVEKKIVLPHICSFSHIGNVSSTNNSLSGKSFIKKSRLISNKSEIKTRKAPDVIMTKNLKKPSKFFDRILKKTENILTN